MNRFLAEFRATPQLLPLVLLLVAVPMAFWSTTADMVRVWIINETFTHGFLILPITLWLVWGQRHALRGIRLHRDLRALILLLPVLALWMMATLIDVAAVQQLAMIATVPATVWLVLGLPITLALLFPLCYLFFAVPLGQSLIPPMMELTADMTVYLVQRSGVPIFRDGLSFQLPTGNWAVVEECSGVRYLIASAALGTIYAYITYQSLTKRLLFVLASLVVPIIANGLRAYGIVMIGHFSGMRYAVGADHLLYGWVFFGIVIFLLFWIGGFWADPPTRSSATTKPAAVEPRSLATFAGGVIVILVALNVTIAAMTSSGGSLPPGATLQPPASAGQWRALAQARTADQWQPLANNPDLLVTQHYGSPATTLTLDVAFYYRQRDNAEAISSLNRLSDPYDGDWKLTAQRRAAGISGNAIESELAFAGRKVLVWSAYIVGERTFASPIRAKLAQAARLLRGETSAAWVTLSTDYDAPLPELRARLADGWDALVRPLPARIAQISASD
jgi:exosortase A